MRYFICRMRKSNVLQGRQDAPRVGWPIRTIPHAQFRRQYLHKIEVVSITVIKSIGYLLGKYSKRKNVRGNSPRGKW